MTMTMTIIRAAYICGNMTGKPFHNIPMFDAMAAQLRAAGIGKVINPAEISRAVGLDPLRPWEEYFAADQKALGELHDEFGDSVISVELPHTLNSRGVVQERALFVHWRWPRVWMFEGFIPWLFDGNLGPETLVAITAAAPLACKRYAELLAEAEQEINNVQDNRT